MLVHSESSYILLKILYLDTHKFLLNKLFKVSKKEISLGAEV